VSRFVGELPDKKVNALLSLNGRDLWIGTDKGLVRWDGSGLSRVSTSEAFAKRGNRYHGTRPGIERLDRDLERPGAR